MGAFYLAILVALLFVRGAGVGGQVSRVVRGLRNNNPGNIKINAKNAWVGKVPLEKNTDGVFEQFYRPEDGLRALMALLKNYVNNLGANTIEKIVARYDEGNPDYIKFIASQTGLLPNMAVYDWNIPAIARAIVKMENGTDLFPDSVYQSVWGGL